jgi:DNA-binding transcriptional LysR family regulator
MTQAKLAPAQMSEDWNELKLVLAVARAGGLVGAAAALGIDHSTAFRRLQAIENRFGHQLFERVASGGYQPTTVGARMASAAERMEDEALALARDIAGRDHRLAGRLRVTSSETLAYRILTPLLAAFRDAHPGVVVELIIDNRVLSLTRRETDIALRPLRPKEGDLWGRKLADVGWAVYGTKAYFARNGFPASQKRLGEHALIGWDESVSGIQAAEWIAAAAPPAAIVYRTTSLVNQLEAARAGIGLAALPCYLGDPEPDLVRALPEPIAELRREMWIVTHSDLKRTARIQAFFALVGDRLAAQRALFEGRRALTPHSRGGIRSKTRLRRPTSGRAHSGSAETRR